MAKDTNKKIDLYRIYYKNSMKPIDWKYYTKFYPEKAKAIQALRLDTGLSLTDAKAVMDEIFSRLEKGQVEKQPSNAEPSYQPSKESYKEDLKTAGKVTGCCLFGIIYIFFGAIFKLTSEYSGKRRR